MNSNNNLMFLEAYKELDELCKQVLSSDRGVSVYIDEMSHESRGYRIPGWERDYKKLKHLRWIRNRLVHENGSFEQNLVSVEDIEWLRTFYRRIIECADPFSLLNQSINLNGKISKPKQFPKSYKESLSRNEDLSDRNIILVGIIIAGLILVGIVILGIILFGIFNVEYVDTI